MTMRRRLCAAILAAATAATTSTAATVAVTATAATASPASAGAVDWAQDGFGAGNTGTNPYERTITASNAGALRYRWSVLSGVSRGTCMFQAPPVVADGRLFLADQSGFGAYRAN